MAVLDRTRSTVLPEAKLYIDGASVCGDLPFGGYKHSGIGRAWGIEGIEEYLEVKAVAVRA